MARSAAEKMLDYRSRKRGQGLRLVQLWAFDRASPEFRARLAREAELVALERERVQHLGRVDAPDAGPVDAPDVELADVPAVDAADADWEDAGAEDAASDDVTDAVLARPAYRGPGQPGRRRPSRIVVAAG